MSDSERRGRSRQRSIRKRYRSMLSPVISDSRKADDTSPSSFREICDLCMEPLKPSRRKVYGRAVTYVNADKRVDMRYLVELALKLFNDNKSKSFKLVKVYKINKFSADYGLTFKAQEDGVKECPVFRGVVYAMGGTLEALFCEIKDDDDEVTLLPDDDDYVSSDQSVQIKLESEDGQPLLM